MASNYFKIKKGTNLEPQSGSTVTAEGDLAYRDDTKKLELHDGTSADNVVLEAKAGTLTNKTIDADSNTITNIENADIKSGANIARNKLASGTPNYVLVNDGSGVLSEEAQLTPAQGGTGADLSAATGVVHVAAGVVTASNIVNADVDNAAAIARTKLASGSANHVIINDGSGVLSSEAQLASTRGGTGVNNAGSLTYGSNNISLTTSGDTSLTLPTSGTVATLAGTETLSNKSVSDALTLAEISTPSNPAASNLKVYAKSDDKLYTLNSSGVETPVGSSNFLTATSGQTIAARLLVYVSDGTDGNTTGRVYKLEPYTDYLSAGNQIFPIGFTTASSTNGSSVVVQTSGVLSGFSSLIVGAVYYADNSGAITTTPDPEVNVSQLPVGIAISATELLIQLPSKDRLESEKLGRNFLDKNYIGNHSGQYLTSFGYNLYKDAAGAVPVDGSGGSPTTVTNSAQTSSNFSGNTSLRLSKSAANGQGEGMSIDFAIKPVDTEGSLQINFQFVASANLVTGTSSDVRIFIYDLANASLITPSITTLPTATSSGFGTYSATFNTTSSTSYRLIFHVATTNALAYDLDVADVQVGDVKASSIAPSGTITNWSNSLTFTPSVAAFGTCTNVDFWSRRVGDSLQVRGSFTTGTVAAATARISIDPSLTIDVAKIPSGVKARCGDGALLSAAAGPSVFMGGSGGEWYMILDSTETSLVSFAFRNSGGNYNKDNATTFGIASGDSISVEFEVPIVEWA